MSGLTEEEVVAQLDEEGNGRLWEDEEFPADIASLYRSKYAIAPYDKTTFDSITWARPHEFASSPEYFKDLNHVGNIAESRGLDDAWFLGALSLVANHSEPLIENNFGSGPDGFNKHGIFTARFYKNGEWKTVLTDTRLPCAVPTEDIPDIKFPKVPVPLYGRCLSINEQWMALLEKAYAKLHGSYEALHTGSAAEAIVDLTGGSVQKIHLNESSWRAQADSGALWEVLKKAKANNCLLGVMHNLQGAAPHEETFFGILKNRLYGIIDLREYYGYRLIQIRSPWERGGWKGDWSNDSRLWSENPEVLAKIRTDPSIKWVRSETGDGTAWMCYNDLVSEFNKIYIGHVFHDNRHKQYCAKGEWVGKTAGGVPRPRGMELAASTTSNLDEMGVSAVPDDRRFLRGLGQQIILPDGDANWFNNPQYRLTVEKETEVFLSLMQQDRRGALTLRENHPISFEVVRMRKDPHHFRVWDYNPSEVVARSAVVKFAQREVVHEGLLLEPGYAYNVVPHAHRHAREGKFILRLFAKQPVLVERVPDTYSVFLTGAWDRTTDRDSMGGPLQLPDGSHVKDNHKWCQNPQYWIKLPSDTSGSGRTVDLKLVVRRTDKAKDTVKNNRKASRDAEKAEVEHLVGMVVCRVPAEEGAAGKKGKKDQQEAGSKTATVAGGMTTMLGGDRTMAATSKDSTLKRRRPGKRGENSAYYEEMQMIQRKLYIRKDEDWYRLSDYTSTDEATMTLTRLDPAWFPRGLLVIPTLNEKNVRGAFSFEVHSDTAGVVVQELLESKTKTLCGSWDAETAGGSHLCSEWRKNPKFSLKLNCSEEAAVTITLSRAEKEWRKECAKDALGCMIGFYIYTGPKPTRDQSTVMHEGRPWTESAFVPMHEVSTPAQFKLQPLPEDEVYVIMPATFESGKKGGFFLSVVTDADFSLRKDVTVAATARHAAPR